MTFINKDDLHKIGFMLLYNALREQNMVDANIKIIKKKQITIDDELLVEIAKYSIVYVSTKEVNQLFDYIGKLMNTNYNVDMILLGLLILNYWNNTQKNIKKMILQSKLNRAIPIVKKLINNEQVIKDTYETYRIFYRATETEKKENLTKPKWRWK